MFSFFAFNLENFTLGRLSVASEKYEVCRSGHKVGPQTPKCCSLCLIEMSKACPRQRRATRCVFVPSSMWICVCVSPLVLEAVSVFVSQQIRFLCATGQASGDCVWKVCFIGNLPKGGRVKSKAIKEGNFFWIIKRLSLHWIDQNTFKKLATIKFNKAFLDLRLVG